MTILGTEESDQDIMVNLSHCAHEHAKAIHASYLLKDHQTHFDDQALTLKLEATQSELQSLMQRLS